MRLYDSRRRSVEPFEAADGQVRMYVCGITPYDTTHLGHAFTYLVFDVLARSLRRHGLQVTYVQNVTDVDDDLLARARRDGREWRALAEENVRLFRADLAALNAIPPDVYPSASDAIDQMLPIISRLLQSGYAYPAGGNVYFRVSRRPSYGDLSGLGRDEMLRLSAERGADPADPRKEDPLDFLLWQASRADEPSWETPWGPGRPGWHIECSAMACHYLGPRLDIHGGGGDLIYPHHEGEIAQSEAFTGEHPFSRFWVHTAMLRYQGEKMSKSLGNMLFVRELRQRYGADAIRLSLLSHHYRENFDFEESELSPAQDLADRLRAALAAPSGESGREAGSHQYLESGLAALDDDLNTPLAVSSLRALLDQPATATRRLAIQTLGDTLGLTFTPRQEPPALEELERRQAGEQFEQQPRL